MNRKKIERGPAVLAVLLVVLVVAACAIRLRGNEDQISSKASADQAVLRAGFKGCGEPFAIAADGALT